MTMISFPLIYIIWVLDACFPMSLDTGLSMSPLCNVVSPQLNLSVTERLMIFIASFAYFFISLEASPLTQNCFCPLKIEIFILIHWNTHDIRKRSLSCSTYLTRIHLKNLWWPVFRYLFIFFSMSTFPVMNLNINKISPSGN